MVAAAGGTAVRSADELHRRRTVWDRGLPAKIGISGGLPHRSGGRPPPNVFSHTLLLEHVLAAPESPMPEPISHLVDIGEGLRLHVTEVGSGPPVVFLHGSGPGASGPSNFGANAAYLAAHGYRAILVDSLGYGKSDKPVDRPYTLEVMAGAVLGALDTLGVPRATFVGNSQGGAQAIWIALNHPERVERLVLMAPGGLEPRETYMELRGIRSMMKALYGPDGLTAEGLKMVFERQVVDPSLVPAELIAERFAVASAQPLHVFQSMRVTDQSDRLDELKMPVLALWGMDDCFCPVSGAIKIAERVPHARVVLLTRCGHWVMVEHADVFNRTLVDFLNHG